MEGTIRIVSTRGYAFISLDASGDQLFCHASELPAGEFDKLLAGDRVVFDVSRDGEGRPRAVDVRRVAPSNALERDWTSV